MTTRRNNSKKLPSFLFKSNGVSNDAAMEPIVKLWLLRMLVLLGGHQKFFNRHGFQSDGVATALGLIDQSIEDGADDTEITLSADDNFNPTAVRRTLRRLHAQAEAQASVLTVAPILAANTRKLAAKVELTELECRVLEFTVMLHAEPLLDEVADLLGELSSQRVNRALAIILNAPEHEVKESLSSRAALSRCGLVTLDTNRFSMPLKSKLDLITSRFGERMLLEEQDPLQLIRDTVFLSRPCSLAVDNYPHARNELDILLPYIKKALSSRRSGVNILVYGPPGTGKSELARLIAQQMCCDLFEVASEDEDGDPVEGEQRLRSYKAALSLLSHQRSLVLFDEIEDVFNDGNGMFGRKSTAQLRKAWINRMLEENPIPTIWLSNSIHCMDAAFLRRFDLVMELDVPPRSERERIVREHASALLTDAAITRIANAEELSPAVITRAASVVSSISDVLDETQRSTAMELLISHVLTAQGHQALKKSASILPDYYDPDYINTKADLVSLATGFRQHQFARLCLYGPPGTGKSAFAHWLAQTLNKPLLTKKASDLISMWVGGTEKNLARAFQEASQSGAVLLLDEVDSFLQDRRGAQHSWEVTGVNEMLTQMESFEGIFIASTNLMEGLDQAALRRFDIKLHFDYLTSAQTWRLFCHQCASLGLTEPAPALEAELKRLAVVTPGDFAVVARQHRFRQFSAPEQLLQVLKEECSLKEDGLRKPMGFL